MVKLARDPRWSIFDVDTGLPSLSGPLLQRVPFPNTPPESFRPWRQRNMRYITTLVTFVVRVLYFIALDYPRLEAVAERVRYERYANSFDYVPMSQLSMKEPNRLNIEPSCQFPRVWLLEIPGCIIVEPWVANWMWAFEREGLSFNMEV
jgi:hypothetical protein